jgi:ubiquinone/menaquinone biosynthesis C-methylase UbiE
MPQEALMYGKSAAYYDAIYRMVGLDYEADAARVHQIVQANKKSPGRRLLDVACGTGRHDEYLKRWYEVQGADLSPEMLEIARARNPELSFHRADMAQIDLGETFDAVICLFSSIGYVQTVERLHQTLNAFAQHTVPGGVVVVDGWLQPEEWIPGSLHANLVDEPDVKVARFSRSEQVGMLSVMEMHHLIVTRDGSETFVERHELGLFTVEQYCEAFEAAGLTVAHDPTGGFRERSLYVGARPV